MEFTTYIEEKVVGQTSFDDCLHIAAATIEKMKEKEFDTVKTFREIKEKISKDLIGKPAQQIKDYLQANSLKLQS